MKKIFIGLLLVITTIFSSENPKAVIVFDASGSMWGKVDGQTKIEIARASLKNLINDWNPNVELGLIAYGHRKKGDCNDIETIIPVGEIDKSTMISTVLSIMPKGKTPISRSIKKAAQELRYTEEKATVILISDGKETCDPDPCATAKELENEGIDFVTHVIGFNVDQKTDEQLECIASATGGEYFSAKNATALNDAMRSIVKKVEVVEPVKKVEPKPVVKKLKNNLVITAIEKEGGKWIEAFHIIFPVIDGEKQRDITNCYSKKKKECLKQIPLGNYILSSKYNEFKKDTEFEIKAGEVTKLNIIMGQTGEVKISTSEKEGGKWVEAFHIISPVVDGEKQRDITNCYSKKKKECLKQIPLGNYILSSKYNEFKKDTEFEIKAGVDFKNGQPTPAQMQIIREHMESSMFPVKKKEILQDAKGLKEAQKCLEKADTLKEANSCATDDEDKFEEWNENEKKSVLKDIAEFEKMLPCIEKSENMKTLMQCFPNDY